MPEWWPAVVVLLVLATAGMMLKKPVFLVVSAVLAAPSGAENGMALAGPAILVTLLVVAGARYGQSDQQGPHKRPTFALIFPWTELNNTHDINECKVL